MSADNDIRWLQRFSNYQKALAKLRKAVELFQKETNYSVDVDELLTEGLIQRFEYTHELAWSVMKDYLEYQGYTDIGGSRDAIRKALAANLIDDAKWMETIKDRNLTSHNYDEETAARIYENIVDVYFSMFCKFEKKMIEKSEELHSK